MMHVGKHGNLEWMPGKTVGLSASCAPDAALGDLPMSNPWALHGIVERLLEAADRRLWAEPDPQLLADLKQAYLNTEGELEAGPDTRTPAERTS